MKPATCFTKTFSIAFFLFIFFTTISPSQIPFLVKDMRPGAIGGFESQQSTNVFQPFNFDIVWKTANLIFFVAADNSNATPITNKELWRSDGTDAGTYMLKDIYPGVTSSYPADFTEINGWLFFVADDGVNGRELWKTDGTTTGTQLVKDLRPGSIGGFQTQQSGNNIFWDLHFYNVGQIGSEFFFVAIDNSNNTVINNRELWKSDGTDAGTVKVKEIYNGINGSEPEDFTAFNGMIYFAARDGITGRELWKTDGTTAGTQLVKDIRPGQIGGFEYQSTGNNTFFDLPFVKVGQSASEFYFVAVDTSNNTPISNRELWKSDGTANGTSMLLDIYPGITGSSPRNFQYANNKLFFAADDPINGNELWALDGVIAAIDEITEISIELYPNPSGDYFEIKSTDASKRIDYIEIYDIGGSKLLRKEVNAIQKRIDISSLSPGMYFIKASCGTAFSVLKLVVQD